MYTKPEEITTSLLEDTRRPYAKPEVLHELELETRAGSPLGLPDPLDFTGANPF